MGAAGAGLVAVGYGLGVGWDFLSSRRPADDAVLDIDFGAEQFVHDGEAHASLAALLTALGGTQSSGKIDIGPHVIADAPEMVANGDFAAGTSGWTPFASGTIAVVDGACQLNGNGGSLPGFSQALALQKGHAYQVRLRMRKMGVGATHPTAAVTVQDVANLSGTSQTHLISGNVTAFAEHRSLFSASSATMYVGGRQIENPSTGTTQYDDFSVREVLPFAGFVQGGFAAIVSGVAPAAALGDKVLLEASCGGLASTDPHERNRVRLVWGADTVLRLVVTAKNVDVASLELGSVAPDAPFEALLSVENNLFRAALRGRPVQVDTGGDLPGFAKFYLGRQNAPGSTFDGAFSRVRIYGRPWWEGELYERAADTSSIAMWGDSLTAGANAGSDQYRPPQAAQLLYTPARSVINLGLGGQTSTQVAARMGAVPIKVTVSGNYIPTSSPVAVSDKNINVLYNSGTYSGTQRGWLAGIYGTMQTDAAGNWSFARFAPGLLTACPPDSTFRLELPERLRRRIAWLWLGRNGAQSGHTVEGDITHAVNSIGHRRFLVGSILTSTADVNKGFILERNALLASRYGARYVDVFTALRDAHDGSPADLADVEASQTPTSLRSDAVHLNAAGYAVVAASFKAANDAMEAAGWPG